MLYRLNTSGRLVADLDAVYAAEYAVLYTMEPAFDRLSDKPSVTAADVSRYDAEDGLSLAAECHCEPLDDETKPTYTMVTYDHGTGRREYRGLSEGEASLICGRVGYDLPRWGHEVKVGPRDTTGRLLPIGAAGSEVIIRRGSVG